MKVYKLDKWVLMNTEYAMEHYRAYIIEKIGMFDDAVVTAKIDAKTVGVFDRKVASHWMQQAYYGGPLPLGPHLLVIPPDKTFKFEGTATKFAHIAGKLLDLDVGEVLPGDYLSRFANQHNEYVKVVQGTDVGTGTSMADGDEVELYSLTPSTIEEYLFNSRTYVNRVTTGSPAETWGNLGVRVYLDGVPFDHLLAATGRRGWDRMRLELPNTTLNRSLDPFTLDDSPIRVAGDHTLSVKLMNVSGATLFATTEATFRFLAACIYKKAA